MVFINGGLFMCSLLLLLWGLKPTRLYLSTVPQLSGWQRIVCIILALLLLWLISFLNAWMESFIQSVQFR